MLLSFLQKLLYVTVQGILPAARPGSAPGRSQEVKAPTLFSGPKQEANSWSEFSGDL